MSNFVIQVPKKFFFNFLEKEKENEILKQDCLESLLYAKSVLFFDLFVYFVLNGNVRSYFFISRIFSFYEFRGVEERFLGRVREESEKESQRENEGKEEKDGTEEKGGKGKGEKEEKEAKEEKGGKEERDKDEEEPKEQQMNKQRGKKKQPAIQQQKKSKQQKIPNKFNFEKFHEIFCFVKKLNSFEILDALLYYDIRTRKIIFENDLEKKKDTPILYFELILFDENKKLKNKAMNEIKRRQNLSKET